MLEVTKRITIPNDKLLPVMVEKLDSCIGKKAILPLRGRSMRPFLEDDRDMGVFVSMKGEEIHVGDPVLAEVSEGFFVMHRIVSLEGDDVTLLGDGNLSCEYCRRQDIRAKVIGFYRKGRKTMDAIDGWKWRTYSWFWMRLRPIRRYLLFLFHPHIPARFKTKKEDR